MLKNRSVVAAIIGLLLLATAFPLSTTQVSQTEAVPLTWTLTQYEYATDSGLSNDNYYTNSAGNEVHSPAYSTDGSVPAGATAECNDGTYSFSQSRSGTCSSHGGVYQWLI